MKADQYQMVFISTAGNVLFSVSDPNIDVLETRLIERVAAIGAESGTCRLLKNGVQVCDAIIKRGASINAPGADQ